MSTRSIETKSWISRSLISVPVRIQYEQIYREVSYVWIDIKKQSIQNKGFGIYYGAVTNPLSVTCVNRKVMEITGWRDIKGRLQKLLLLAPSLLPFEDQLENSCILLSNILSCY